MIELFNLSYFYLHCIFHLPYSLSKIVYETYLLGTNCIRMSYLNISMKEISFLKKCCLTFVIKYVENMRELLHLLKKLVKFAGD